MLAPDGGKDQNQADDSGNQDFMLPAYVIHIPEQAVGLMNRIRRSFTQQDSSRPLIPEEAFAHCHVAGFGCGDDEMVLFYPFDKAEHGMACFQLSNERGAPDSWVEVGKLRSLHGVRLRHH